MKIIPVLDLLSGHVVHAVRGLRDQYRPIESDLAAGSSPKVIATALRQATGCDTVYIADLDSIQGREPNWSSIRDLVNDRWRIWLDPGITNLQRGRLWTAFERQHGSLDSLVVGAESLANLRELGLLLAEWGPNRIVFSLDMLRGSVVANDVVLQDSSPLEVVQAVWDVGVRRIIILDLAGVGSGEGVPTLSLCREIRRKFSDVELTTGGGIRGQHDLQAAALAGCDRILIASALHRGSITRADIDQIEFEDE